MAKWSWALRRIEVHLTINNRVSLRPSLLLLNHLSALSMDKHADFWAKVIAESAIQRKVKEGG